jgi:site-specific DNA-adenine methylase
MLNTMIRWTRYAGDKHLSDDFNKAVSKDKSVVYVEPFFGSGSVFFNLKKEYRRYILNDVDQDLMNAVQSFMDVDYSVYKKAVDGVFSKFGSIKEKSGYEEFVSWFNKNFFRKSKDLVLEGFYYHMLINACLNSKPKSDDGGFTQGWGNRSLELSEEEYGVIHKVLQKRKPVLLSKDYKKIIEQYDDDETLFFMDPPVNEIPDLNNLHGQVVLASHLTKPDPVQ